MKQKKGKSSKTSREAPRGAAAAPAAAHDDPSPSPSPSPSVMQPPAPSTDMPPATQTSATLALDGETDPYLPFGRSFARDLFVFHNPRENKRLGAFVFECGDLRDVAHTVGEAKRKYGTANLDFVLSDTHFEVLARNLLMLHAVAQTELADRAAVTALTRHIGQLAYSQFLDPATRGFWTTHMRACLAADWTAPDAQVRILDDSTRRGRNGFYSTVHAKGGPGIQLHAYTAFNRVLHRLLNENGSKLHRNGDPPNLERDLQAAIADVVFFPDYGGVPKPTALAINPTMLVTVPGGEPGNVRFTSPLGMTPLDAFHLDPFEDFRGFMTRDLERWVLTLVDVFGSGATATPLSGTYPPVAAWPKLPLPPPRAQFRCRIGVIGGHPLSVMENLVAMQTAGQTSYAAIETDRVLPLWFNVVQTGSIIDSCGMLNVLVHASPLLTTNWDSERSLICTATSHMTSIAKTRLAFLHRTMGLPLEVLPTLLGVNLYDRPHHDHWSTHTTQFAWCAEQTMSIREGSAKGRQEFTFYKLAAPTVPIALRESPFLINALVRCAELLLGPDSVAMAGRHAGSHATAALLIKLIGFALASSRLTWTGADFLMSAPWPAMPELWDALRDSAVVTSSFAELQAQGMLYGFPVADGVGYATDVCRIEGKLDTAALDAARTAAPLSLMVLEINHGGIVHQFRSFTTKAINDGKQLRVATYVPQYIVEDFADGELPARPSLPRGANTPVVLASIATELVPVNARAGVYSGIVYFPNVTRFNAPSPSQPTVLSPHRDLPVVHAAEHKDEIHIVLAIPRARISDIDSLKGCDLATRQKSVGAIMVEYGTGSKKKVQAFQMPCGPALLKEINALAVHPHNRVQLVMHRYLAPVSPMFSVWPLIANVADYSDVYKPNNLGVTSAQYAGIDTVLRVGSVETSQAISDMAKRAPKGAHFALMQTLNVMTAVGSLFEAVWSGTRVLELVTAESGKIAAVILFNRLSVIPPADASRGYTPVLDCSYILSPEHHSNRRADPATARLLAQIATKCTVRHSAGRSIVHRLRKPEPFMTDIFEYLRSAAKSAPCEDVPNEHGFDTAFFKQLKPKLTRCSVVQLYPTQDRDESWKPAMDMPAAQQVAVVPPHTQGAAAAAAARAASGVDEDVDSRIEEL
ncbi:hypothetical protein H9P43_007246 [Blastocladiella emersonii ATCC 22665]|nr:hypothetical protein H9P43_007246 [Blastocladiella emersonii ATCC 22665]